MLGFTTSKKNQLPLSATNKPFSGFSLNFLGYSIGPGGESPSYIDSVKYSFSFSFAHQNLYTPLPHVCYIFPSLFFCAQNSILD
jgi:hypothetical protein